MSFQYTGLGGHLDNVPHVIQSESSLEVFDLASLTKIVCTFSLFLDYAKKHSLGLRFFHQPLIDKIPELKNTSLASVNVRECLEHRSGLPAHIYFFEPHRSKAFWQKPRNDLHTFLLNKIVKLPLRDDFRVVYSDIGFLLLLVFFERLCEKTIFEAWEEWKTAYLPSDTSVLFRVSDLTKLNPTEDRYPHGEVNDDNCYGLGGSSTHAGLFGTAIDLWTWLQTIRSELRSLSDVYNQLLCTPSGRFQLGWDTPTAPMEFSQAGSFASTSVRGHLGYTGTALWWDMNTNLAGVLLSNRVFPSATEASKSEIRLLRQKFFNALWAKRLNSFL